MSSSDFLLVSLMSLSLSSLEALPTHPDQLPPNVPNEIYE